MKCTKDQIKHLLPEPFSSLPLALVPDSHYESNRLKNWTTIYLETREANFLYMSTTLENCGQHNYGIPFVKAPFCAYLV